MPPTRHPTVIGPVGATHASPPGIDRIDGGVAITRYLPVRTLAGTARGRSCAVVTSRLALGCRGAIAGGIATPPRGDPVLATRVRTRCPPRRHATVIGPVRATHASPSEQRPTGIACFGGMRGTHGFGQCPERHRSRSRRGDSITRGPPVLGPEGVATIPRGDPVATVALSVGKRWATHASPLPVRRQAFGFSSALRHAMPDPRARKRAGSPS